MVRYIVYIIFKFEKFNTKMELSVGILSELGHLFLQEKNEIISGSGIKLHDWEISFLHLNGFSAAFR